MMKCKVVNLEAYKKFRPIKLKIKIAKKKCKNVCSKIKKYKKIIGGN